mmetsp:Transcript_23927/g.65688  ORF Transcript_23927/g.65688 Transcript_23927/m.65688 type:complete len:212 (-) Transcript_23927:12-647(-)
MRGPEALASAAALLPLLPPPLPATMLLLLPRASRAAAAAAGSSSPINAPSMASCRESKRRLNVLLWECASPCARGSRHRQCAALSRSSASLPLPPPLPPLFPPRPPLLLQPLPAPLPAPLLLLLLLRVGAATMAASACSRPGAWWRRAVGSVRSRAVTRRSRETHTGPALTLGCSAAASMGVTIPAVLEARAEASRRMPPTSRNSCSLVNK